MDRHLMTQCAVGRGVNRESFDHGQNVFHLTPPEQICPLKNFEVGLQIPPSPQTWPMGKAKN